MERSLNLDLLRGALSRRSGLPAAEELQRLIGQVEVQLFLQRPELPPELFNTAWYLHGVASVNGARELYTVARQRQAFLVSAHIFDLALNQDNWTSTERLSFGFAAAIGYRRGGRDPNATAIFNRLRADIHVQTAVAEHLGTLSLQAGLAFLGFETKTLFSWFSTWRWQLAALARESAMADLSSTALGPAHLVILGAEDLLQYFARGNTGRLQSGLARLRRVAAGEAGPSDLHSEWVAAHLLNFAGEAELGSLWNPRVLPPTVPALVRQAFTIGSPPVLTLWEPQRDLLTGSRSPFDPSVRRTVLAVPTSGGKSLVAQMLAVEHLSRTNHSVCYVAPTRSLGREVRRAMASRVRILQKETGSEQPDYPSVWDMFAADEPPAPADVEVMTPERLGHLLRHDPAAALDRFGMFIFDEAQLLKESGRGFVLESVIAVLDYLTRDTGHQIVLISAAMGNAGAIAQWLSPDGQCLHHESQWRGPRRLHAAFNTKAIWHETRTQDGAGPTWSYRHTTELQGRIRLRLADGHTTELSTQGDTGWRLVRKSKDGISRRTGLPTDSTRSTKQYVIASQMITALGHAGSVLVVATTRKQAELLAKGLAAECDEQPTLAPLVDFVRQQLGADHPLVDALRHGVGFHHAGLPIEVLEALEEAVRGDSLPYLTCTSTLTDGVNLPVRTVVIYDQAYQDQAEEARLRGARLVNAMGRAGRAGKETEGWIVLVRAAEPTEQDFRDLDPGPEALAVTSSLTTDIALQSFAEMERQLRDDADAVFSAADTVGDFISFVWLLLAIEEGRGTDPAAVNLDAIVGCTLAATQSADARTTLTRVSEATRRTYAASAPDARRRWPRTGTSIGTARSMDDLASRIAAAILRADAEGRLPDMRDPEQAIAQLPTMFAELLQRPEAPEWRFRVSPQGADIDVQPRALLRDWISGQPLADLANAHLWAATNPASRIAQMVSAVTAYFEHYLAWTVSTMVELVNARLSDADSEARLCPELGGYIRYGVNTPHALLLMTSGIRSRRLAHAVVAAMPSDLQATHEDMRLWLAGMSIAEWRERFEASSSEVLDLLDITRLRSRSLLKTLLETGTVAVTLPGLAAAGAPQHSQLSLEPARDHAPPEPLALYVADEMVATISPQDHADVRAILDTGLDLTLELGHTADPPVLRLSMPLDDGAA